MNRRLERGYDRLSAVYVWLERLRFGNALQRARISLLPELSNFQRVLFLGDGDGRLLEAFARLHPDAHIVSADISPAMLKLQQRRVAADHCDQQIVWQQGDLELLNFSHDTFDLVVTAFFLDCFDERQLERLLPKIASWLDGDAAWYHVDFHLPGSGWHRVQARCWLAVMHAFFRWQTGLQSRRLVDANVKLRSLGFAAVRQRDFAGDTLRATLYRRLPRGSRAEPDVR